VGKGKQIKLTGDPTSDDFKKAYAAAVGGEATTRPTLRRIRRARIGALITSYLNGDAFASFGEGSKPRYRSRMDQIRRDHGHRAVGASRRSAHRGEDTQVARQQAGAKIDTLKKLRILIRHA